jgi:CheY-like chemotaxis protein
MDRFMSKPIPVKTLKDITSTSNYAMASFVHIDNLTNVYSITPACKQVVDAGHLLDARFDESFDALEASFSKCPADSISGSIRSESSSSGNAAKPSCLLVENTPDDGVHSLQRFVELNGWKSVVVTSGEDALRLLKMRNWGFVIIDNDLPFFSGINCIARFRDWETHSCIAKQQNIYIMSDCYNPLSVPSGFDGVLKKPFDPSQVVNALERARH